METRMIPLVMSKLCIYVDCFNRYQMKKYFLSMLLFNIACNQSSKKQIKYQDTTTSIPIVQSLKKSNDPQDFMKDSMRLVGDTIWGNFDGKNTNEMAFVKKIKSGSGNPVDEGTPDEYEIEFNQPSLSPIKIGCCEAILINEGDLFDNSKDGISVYQSPENGTLYTISTIIYGHGGFDTVIKPFLIYENDSTLSRHYLSSLVVRKSDSICHINIDNQFECSLVRSMR
jgi:hypothetical protein